MDFIGGSGWVVCAYSTPVGESPMRRPLKLL